MATFLFVCLDITDLWKVLFRLSPFFFFCNLQEVRREKKDGGHKPDRD